MIRTSTYYRCTPTPFINRPAVSGSELSAGQDDDTVAAVAHKDGSLDGSDEDLAVEAVVHRDGVAVVVQVDVAVVAVLDLELLAADRPGQPACLVINWGGDNIMIIVI